MSRGHSHSCHAKWSQDAYGESTLFLPPSLGEIGFLYIVNDRLGGEVTSYISYKNLEWSI